MSHFDQSQRLLHPPSWVPPKLWSLCVWTKPLHLASFSPYLHTLDYHTQVLLPYPPTDEPWERRNRSGVLKGAYGNCDHLNCVFSGFWECLELCLRGLHLGVTWLRNWTTHTGDVLMSITPTTLWIGPRFRIPYWQVSALMLFSVGFPF